MATTKTQRWAILGIMVVMVVGTMGSFAVMILSTKNSQKDQAYAQQVQEKYSREYKEYQAKVDAQTKELSNKYYASLSQYTSRVGSFDRDSVKSLSHEDLLAGEGEEIKDDTKFAVYYIGWNPKGKIFDQSIENNALKAPLSIADGLKNASLVDGWKEGLVGMKVGGVRELTIPSDKAYGETAHSDDIPANTPLKFIVLAIPLPETFEQPDSTELMKVYSELYQ